MRKANREAAGSIGTEAEPFDVVDDCPAVSPTAMIEHAQRSACEVVVKMDELAEEVNKLAPLLGFKWRKNALLNSLNRGLDLTQYAPALKRKMKQFESFVVRISRALDQPFCFKPLQDKAEC